MKGESPLIPDLDISGCALIAEPMFYGARPALRKPSTVAVIRKNAGRLSADDIAKALCWSRSRLDEVARREHIDLSFPPKPKLKKEPDPIGA